MRNVFCAALLLSYVHPIMGHEPSCAATPLSRKEAERLVFSTPVALDAKKRGGKLAAVQYKPPEAKEVFYYVMLLSTVSTPTTPLDNGMLGYFSVNKETGRVVNVAGEDVIGTELKKLQRELRDRHCIGRELVTKGQIVEP